MNAINQTALTARRKMQFFLFLPIFIIPLFTLLFWLLGGGEGDAVAATAKHTVNGLNLQLPSARLKDESKLTKLDYYRRADQDSAKRLTLIKNDPYYRLARLSGLQPDTAKLASQPRTPSQSSGFRTNPYRSHLARDSDRNELNVYRKLATLNAALNSSSPSASKALPVMREAYSPELARVEDAMQTLRRKDTAIDPELSELSKMVDKLVALQKGTPEVNKEERPSGGAHTVRLPVLRPRG
ncbi:hypothetical protein ACQ86N_02475 [Puia sp. P3]|uniref:hypothetical protein n=1 Tax=Puia sp. P3 TaxID=3423952 RepID=UPI003D672FB1